MTTDANEPRERLARAIGPFAHDWEDEWGPEPRCRHCNWIKSAAPASCEYSPLGPPALTDERALGWAVGEIRKAGYQWNKTHYWTAFDGPWGDRSVPVTDNDAEDAMRLLLAVLEAKGGRG